MGATKIQWANKVWNPLSGCSSISAGCAHCYARRMATRLAGRYGYPRDEPFRVTAHRDKFIEPFNWKKPSRIFVCSMGDLFHSNVARRDIEDIFDVMKYCHRHTFMVLTKRPGRMQALIKEPLPNVWLGTSCENQDALNERIQPLFRTPAVVHFISCEPMLGPIDISSAIGPNGIDWLICGSETGPGARHMQPEWARSLHDQCRDAGVPFFMKQMSRHEPIPDDLNVREFPETKQSI